MPQAKLKRERRTYVTATDGVSRKSKHITIRGASPREIVALLKKWGTEPVDQEVSGRGTNVATSSATA
jgi:hypothetical protein